MDRKLIIQYALLSKLVYFQTTDMTNLEQKAFVFLNASVEHENDNEHCKWMYIKMVQTTRTNKWKSQNIFKPNLCVEQAFVPLNN